MVGSKGLTGLGFRGGTLGHIEPERNSRSRPKEDGNKTGSNKKSQKSPSKSRISKRYSNYVSNDPGD